MMSEPRRKTSRLWLQIALILGLCAGLWIALFVVGPRVYHAMLDANDDSFPTLVSFDFMVDGTLHPGRTVSAPTGATIVPIVKFRDNLDPNPQVTLLLVPDLALTPLGTPPVNQQEIPSGDPLPRLPQGSYTIMIKATDRAGNLSVANAGIVISDFPIHDEGGALLKDWKVDFASDGSVHVAGTLLYWAPGRPDQLNPRAVTLNLMDPFNLILDPTGNTPSFHPRSIQSDPRGFAVLEIDEHMKGPFRRAPTKLMLTVAPGPPLVQGIRSRCLIDDFTPFPNVEEAMADMIRTAQAATRPASAETKRNSSQD